MSSLVTLRSSKFPKYFVEMSHPVPKNIAIIPIRSGSQRFKNKNVRTINGLPLFCIAALIAKQSGVFDAIWIAYDVDDLEVRNYCVKFGLNFYLRSMESATSFAST